MNLLLRTGRQSLVVRPHLRELLNSETNRNKLLNDLIEQYYKLTDKL
jgi:hypothetical protein